MSVAEPNRPVDNPGAAAPSGHQAIPSLSGPGEHPVRIALPGQVPSGHEALLTSHDFRPFALIGKWAGGGALIGSDPVEVAAENSDPFQLLATVTEDEADLMVRTARDLPETFVGGGWFGYLGYGIGVPGETPVPQPPSRELLPEFALARYDHLLHLDSDGQWWFEALWTQDRAAQLEARLDALSGRLSRGVSSAGSFKTEPWKSTPSPQGHSRAVQACRERIAAGDLYQANISLRLSSRLEGDPVDLFTEATSKLKPDRAAFLAFQEGAVASLSPELFLARKGREVLSAPIKGTRPRPDDPELAASTYAELKASQKDHAENTMIVDLVRNDLGRVCEPGSVKVSCLAEARPHPGVWHLVSEVEGKLKSGLNDADLLASTFPPGSVTGAPKLAAISTIAELESNARQVFTGAIGFASPYAGLELNVAIRTFEICGDQIWLDAGGGIVNDSDPEDEAEEASSKARPLLEAIGGTRQEPVVVSSSPPVLRPGPQPMPRPDPADGVFETLGVRDGRPIALDAHLDRLTASVAELYGQSIPEGFTEQIRDRVASTEGLARLRIDFHPLNGMTLSVSPHVALSEPVRLVSMTVPGGLGPHKWRDRRLLDLLTANVTSAVPLLVDLDGAVLEAAWANVVIRDQTGSFSTPQLDGRILPGVGRQQMIDRHREGPDRILERRLTIDDLEAAAEIFLVNSLRGLLPVELDG